jgi:putative Mn2+ efflux pump MntP
MGFVSIMTLAVALAIDAFSVAVACGATLPNVTRRHVFRLVWHFGFFQAGMTLLGYGAGVTVRLYIEALDHWVAFALLALVGGKMIRDALAGRPSESRRRGDPTRGGSLILLSVATSIDALSVGIGLSVLGDSIWLPAVVIGVVAALFTAAGLKMGQVATWASGMERWATFLGGLVLIGVGFHVLFSHGVFGA